MAEPDSQSGEVFDVERIRQLVELMKEYDLREIDLQESEQRIRLARGQESAAQPTAPMPAYLPPPPSYAPAPPAAAAPTPPPAAAASGAAESDANIAVIVSPMVGTFYSRANPNAEPYVKIGDYIEPETTVCIIEAMKVFNEIPAEVRGKVVAMLVDDEEPVEFGKPLFKVDTSQ